MDFKNLCQKIDVDGIRAKIPSMPTIPTIPQIKFPKSITKLKSRKIFQSSREDIGNCNSPKQHHQMTPPIPPSEFIDHTPTRISTISSLMHQQNINTYQSADSIDDDCPLPTHVISITNKPISPLHTPKNVFDASQNLEPTNIMNNSSNNMKMTLSEKLQKGYKDFSDFKLKHIFVKKTVVRKDVIQIDEYVQQFNKDLAHKQQEDEKRDQEIAENYRLNFKISRQNTGHSDSITSNESPVINSSVQSIRPSKNVSKQSSDESGMETVRSPTLRQSEKLDEDNNTEINEQHFEQKVSPNMEMVPNTLISNKNNSASNETDISHNQEINKTKEDPATLTKNKSYKERMKRFASYLSQDESDTEYENERVKNIGGPGTRMIAKLRGSSKHNEPMPIVEKNRNQTQEDDKDETDNIKDNRLNTIKYNFRKLRKSVKREQHSQKTDESEDEESIHENKQQSKTEKLTTRLRKFKNSDSSITEASNQLKSKTETVNKSPTRSTFSNKLQTFKKSFKQKSTINNENDFDESFPQKQKCSSTVIKKLKHIKSKKNSNSVEDVVDEDDDDDVTKETATESTNKKDSAASRSKVGNFEEKFEQARQRTLKKLNEKMQQIKFIQKHQEQSNNEKDKPKKVDSEYEEYKKGSNINLLPIITRRGIQENSKEDYEQAEIEEVENIQKEYINQKTRAFWTTKSILSESTESESDVEFPRVLIHQDNSDVFESTLIIAVTRPVPSPPLRRITEILPEERIRPSTPQSKPQDWIPNREIISKFSEETQPNESKLITEKPATRKHYRKRSIDSNSDSDSWILENAKNKQKGLSKDDSRCSSIPGLNAINENEESWKVHTMFHEKKLHKAKSIDIFETNADKGLNGVFEDFDDELKNEPIVKIVNRTLDSADEDSSEDADAADDDNSSRVTKILKETTKNEKTITIEKERSPNIAKNLNKQSQLQQHRVVHQEVNSYESLIDNFDENEEFATESNIEDDRPPSAAPSPPPSKYLPLPPPPLPQRNPSICTLQLTNDATLPPPLPTTKPPLPSPPKIPERTPSMSRIRKPLVKTSSLRLAFNEQVKSTDKGKVNKLISRFEQPQSQIIEKSKIIPRKVFRNESEDLSDDEKNNNDDDDVDVEKNYNNSSNNKIYESAEIAKIDNDITPTNTPRSNSLNLEDDLILPTISITQNINSSIEATAYLKKEESIIPMVLTTNFEEDKNNLTYDNEKSYLLSNDPIISLEMDKNSNFSRANSEYGSPLEYPSSLIGSNEPTPKTDRREQQIRISGKSRRSVTRDHENFYSFDSDEENSYYSLSPSSYIVEI